MKGNENTSRGQVWEWIRAEWKMPFFLKEAKDGIKYLSGFKIAKLLKVSEEAFDVKPT